MHRYWEDMTSEGWLQPSTVCEHFMGRSRKEDGRAHNVVKCKQMVSCGERCVLYHFQIF